jgi:ATP-dependent Clp protease ATP-binding subunit ClpA
VIQQKVEDPLSDSLLSEEFKDCTEVVVDLEDDEVVLRRGDMTEQDRAAPEEAVAAV